MKTIDFSYYIERYNAGDMNEAERIWFEKELSGNRMLQEEVALRRNTDMVLRNRDVLQLRNKLSEIEKKKAATFSQKKHTGKNHFFRYAAVIAGFMLIGSLVLFKGRNVQSDELFNDYYTTYQIQTNTPSRSFDDVTNVNSDYITAVDYYNVSDYRNAAVYFSKVISSDPHYMESRMLYGVSNFEQKNYPIAQRSFTEVIDDNDNFFIEDAQWYLALCYIKTDEKEKAVNQLKTIKNSGSLYRNEARKILRKIK
ncbi:MAG: tetratricopeptide repeat protein [Bacteroidetes bacterium]|jgi:tetratricopeptide (TPR) repeat protein|nr:tetratricopeptide repeat protein [Bacteroidota bacterium]